MTKTVALAMSVLHDLIAAAYNARAHGAGRATPYELLHGRLRNVSHRYQAIRSLISGQFSE